MAGRRSAVDKVLSRKCFSSKGRFICSAISRHFPGFSDESFHLADWCFFHQIHQLRLKKHQAQRVLQSLGVRVFLNVVLQDQEFYPLDKIFLIPNVAKNPADLLGVKRFQVFSPAQVAGPISGIFRPRDRPSTDMLAAGGDTQSFGGLGIELESSLGQAFGTSQLLRMSDPVYDLLTRILTIEAIDLFESLFEIFSGHYCSWPFSSHV
jgi:hypothetical protein